MIAPTGTDDAGGRHLGLDEWFVGSALGRKLAAEIPRREACIVPTIVQLELAKWLRREVGEERADEVIAYTHKCIVVALDTQIALLAADLHREHGLATADAVVYATAQSRSADLLTCDAQLAKLPGVVCFR